MRSYKVSTELGACQGMKYRYRRKPTKCPVCAAPKLAEFLYGMPDGGDQLKHDIKTGRIVIGGCLISEDDPAWQCTNCKTNIYKQQKDFWPT